MNACAGPSFERNGTDVDIAAASAVAPRSATPTTSATLRRDRWAAGWKRGWKRVSAARGLRHRRALAARDGLLHFDPRHLQLVEHGVDELDLFAAQVALGLGLQELQDVDGVARLLEVQLALAVRP